MSLVAASFKCKWCDVTIQEADLVEDLVVDGETYGCVNSFCYLGDTLDVDGGAIQKWMDKVLGAYTISDIQNSPAFWIDTSHRLHMKLSATRDKSPHTPLHRL